MTIVLNYPHDTSSHQPLMLSSRDIWRLGEEARAQVDGGATPALSFTNLAARTRTLRINGLELQTYWAFEPEVRDDRGYAVMAAIEYDREVPRTALLSLNSTILAERDDVTMSTAAHELGHAVFDAPGWIAADEKSGEESGDVTRRFRSVMRRYRSSKPLDPAEWRANEFMGSFLAPRRLLQWQMIKALRELKLPRRLSAHGAVVLDPGRLGFAEAQAVVDELARAFGLSQAFIEYRLVRYGMAPKAAQ